jgi:Flp pilus assembly protein TadG
MSFIVRRWRSSRRRWDEGAAAIEAALVLPVLFLAVLGIVEFGMAVWQWNTMLLAVEQAGRYVMVNNSTCDVACAETQMQSVLSSAAVCTTPTSGQICVSATCSNPTTCTPTTASTTMTLSAAYSFNLLSLFTPFTITTQGTVPLD